VEKTEGENIYHRLGLVELGNENLQTKVENSQLRHQIVIGNNLLNQTEPEFQSHIQTPPKK